MSNDTIKQTAQELFASTTHQELWANPKGEFFTSENIGALSLEAGEKLIKFERPEVATEDKPVKPLNALETIALVQKATSLEDLKAFETDERKGVKAAYESKYTELVAKIEVNLEENKKIQETGATEGTDGDKGTQG
jgi:hypothetical protein